MKLTNELKAGIMVAAGIAVVAIFWVKTTDFSGKPYHVKTHFNYAEGVKVDSIVKLAGIEVGRVEAVQFNYDPDTKVELVLAVNKNARIREDSVAFISQSGLIGDAYIGITPGSADKQFVKDGAILISEDPVEMRKIARKAEGIAENLERTLAELKNLAGGLTGVVSDNKVRIDNITANLEQTTVNFKEFSEDVKQHPWKLLSKGK